MTFRRVRAISERFAIETSGREKEVGDSRATCCLSSISLGFHYTKQYIRDKMALELLTARICFLPVRTPNHLYMIVLR